MPYLGAVRGLRWGECAGLRLRDLDFLAGDLTVAVQLTRGTKARSVLGPPKSNAGRRRMAVDRVDIKTAQARLGHSDPRLTLAIYAQAMTEGDRAASDSLEVRFMRPSGEASRGCRGVDGRGDGGSVRAEPA